MTASPRLRALRWMMRHFEKPMLARAKTPGFTRIRSEYIARAILAGRRAREFRWVDEGGVPTRQIAEGHGTLFYIHGGAYILMSAKTHQGIATRLAEGLGLAPVLPDYTLAPETPLPGGVRQVAAAYRSVAARPGPLVIAGDSAGGGMALALLHHILGEGLRVPDAVLTFSPWCDLTLQGESLTTNAASDPFLPASNIEYVRDLILDGHDPRDPLVSPLFGEFAGSPPVLIQAIEDEILRSDAEAMAARLTEQGAKVELEILPHGLHAFQLFHRRIPEADAAVEAALSFARKHLA